MDWNGLNSLIDPKFLIVVACCWVIGYILKQTPHVPDWGIVYIVTACAVAAVIGIQGLSVQSVLQGVLCGASAVYGNQLLKQARKGANEDAS